MAFYLYKMKRLMIALVVMVCAKIGFAQKELLSFDENNKYIYYQVTDAPGLPKDTLLTRAAHFLKSVNPKIKINHSVTPNQQSGQGRFLVYGGVSVLKHEHGEINYTINIECKDQKFRSWLTGFVFTPYQRDRYGNFVPVPGKDIPLEQIINKFDKREADTYLDETGVFCNQLSDKLKSYIKKSAPQKKDEIAKKVVTDNW